MQEQSFLQLRNAISRFIKLEDSDWELLVPYIEEKQLSKHDIFAREGRIATEIGFVIDGDMRHYYTRDGIEKTTYFYFEGHFVSSYLSCVTQTPSELSIQAMTNCTLLVFPYGRMKQLFEVSHKWERFGRLIAEYLAIGLEQRMVGLLMLSPEE